MPARYVHNTPTLPGEVNTDRRNGENLPFPYRDLPFDVSNYIEKCWSVGDLDPDRFFLLPWEEVASNRRAREVTWVIILRNCRGLGVRDGDAAGVTSIKITFWLCYEERAYQRSVIAFMYGHVY